jgi:hypothetical protein
VYVDASGYKPPIGKSPVPFNKLDAVVRRVTKLFHANTKLFHANTNLSREPKRAWPRLLESKEKILEKGLTVWDNFDKVNQIRDRLAGRRRWGRENNYLGVIKEPSNGDITIKVPAMRRGTALVCAQVVNGKLHGRVVWEHRFKSYDIYRDHILNRRARNEKRGWNLESLQELKIQNIETAPKDKHSRKKYLRDHYGHVGYIRIVMNFEHGLPHGVCKRDPDCPFDAGFKTLTYKCGELTEEEQDLKYNIRKQRSTILNGLLESVVQRTPVTSEKETCELSATNGLLDGKYFTSGRRFSESG